VPEPESFWADREYVFTRWQANPEAALVAEVNGRLAGSNFVTNWGSFGFFGPLTILPEFWNQRIAQQLLGPTMDLFAKWSVREAGLSRLHTVRNTLALYQKFGFWPRFLTAIMSKSAACRRGPLVKFSTLSEADKTQAIAAWRKHTDSIYEGLDVTSEILAVENQSWGETLLL
jgi:Acetyltransferase (GNAT) family